LEVQLVDGGRHAVLDGDVAAERGQREVRRRLVWMVVRVPAEHLKNSNDTKTKTIKKQ